MIIKFTIMHLQCKIKSEHMLRDYFYIACFFVEVASLSGVLPDAAMHRKYLHKKNKSLEV